MSVLFSVTVSVSLAAQWFNPFAWLLLRECLGRLEALCERNSVAALHRHLP